MLEAVETLLTPQTDQQDKSPMTLNPSIHYTCGRTMDTNA